MRPVTTGNISKRSHVIKKIKNHLFRFTTRPPLPDDLSFVPLVTERLSGPGVLYHLSRNNSSNHGYYYLDFRNTVRYDSPVLCFFAPVTQQDRIRLVMLLKSK